ncbi:hypothetical protein DHEL01_v206495 [Diaporthe helianthi]|uniref:Uncharacterized protein n=1 Tax=Diaporthe helianthi TaxID=158607 RepID=A0A2P5HXY5_DIAHE|nr:hypothetical protein DHEL01_v206495 [Diaporthe helianthi]
MGGEGPTIAIIRGLKVRVPVLDSFLRANKIDETYGMAPFYHVDPTSHRSFYAQRLKVGIHVPVYLSPRNKAIMRAISNILPTLGRWSTPKRRFPWTSSSL